MRYIKGKWICLMLIILLLLIIPLILHIFHGQGSKQVEYGNKFVETLKENNIIESNNDKIKFNIEKRHDSKNNDEIYVLTSDFYMLELNNENKVISFVDKSETEKVINITLDESAKFAEKYIKKIDGNSYKIKELDKNNTNKDSDFYSVIFSKYEDGYPYLSEEVILNINKNNGKLQGYINRTKSSKHNDIRINISVEEAEKIALESFDKIEKNGKLKGKTYLAFCNDKDSDKLELAYVVEVLNDNSNKVICVSSNSGKIINSTSNIIEKIKVK